QTSTTYIYTLSLHEALPISTPAASVTSSSSGYALPFIMLALLSTSPNLREHTITSAPRAAHSLAISKPMLRLEPVTIATLPSNRSEEHTSELQSRENLVCRL